MTLVALGRVALLEEDVPAAVERFGSSLALSRAIHDDLGTTLSLHHLGWAHLLAGEVDAARTVFDESLALSSRLGYSEGVAYGLEGLVSIAASSGDAERAGRLLGAAETLREQTGLEGAPTFSFHRALVEPIIAGEQGAAFEAARIVGRGMAVGDVVEASAL